MRSSQVVTDYGYERTSTCLADSQSTRTMKSTLAAILILSLCAVSTLAASTASTSMATESTTVPGDSSTVAGDSSTMAGDSSTATTTKSGASNVAISMACVVGVYGGWMALKLAL
ncbi:uncharacterized protein LOC124146544 isoform X1 [Haliotis rufescens]|uniref:uncharacterized protein LOC124146544 isoform X1 n=1 Tax=Haliotis rufescens TaxID=6454 RepID=UPI001EB00E58|nr:uncharacterized protein LOC124146544 isoform X1 [Haliotis rufescens]